MIGRRGEDKDKINVLLNIDNYFGDHQGSPVPILLFFGISAIPAVFYFLYLFLVVPIQFFIAFQIPYMVIVGLKTIGEEGKKKRIYLEQRDDKYGDVSKLVKIVNIYEDGLIEYTNGTVAYILSGFVKTYLNDNEFSIAMEKFLDAIEKYNYDIHLHNVTMEYSLVEDTGRLIQMQDKEMVMERLDFYRDQDEYCDNHSELYRYNIVIRTYKADWKKLREELEEILSSHAAEVWKQIKICNLQEVGDVNNRDLCAIVSYVDLLRDKYKDDENVGAQVLFYGEDVPSEFVKEKEKSHYEERRVVDR